MIPTTVQDLRPDPHRPRVATARGRRMLQDALRDLGAARSIVIDEDGVILAGNGTVDAAHAVGLTKLLVVDATADDLIAVRRSGLTPEEKRRLALVDNRAGELATWSPAGIDAAQDAGVPVEDFWQPSEMAAIVAPPTLTPTLTRTKPGRNDGSVTIRYGKVVIPLTMTQAATLLADVQRWIDEQGSADGYGAHLVARLEGALHARTS